MATSPAQPTTSRIQRGINYGLLALIGLMPFHAFLSVWAGDLFGYQAIWQGWKEVLIVVLLAAAAYQVARDKRLQTRLRTPVIYLSVAFAAIAAITTLIFQPELKAALYGGKTDIEFLVAFAIAFATSGRDLRIPATKVLLISSGLVIAFGVLQVVALPKDFLTQFGYGPTTIEPYLGVDPAVESVRILSTLGGPNQLGSFLILPICLVAALMFKRPRWWHPVFLVAGIYVEWHTYSRAALLGLALALGIIVLMSIPRIWRAPLLLLATIILAGGIQYVVSEAGNRDSKLQYYVFHGNHQINAGVASSTAQHASASEEGLDEAKEHPFGKGLGTAGPASYESSAPQIPENYHLQLAIEAGALGLVAFLGVCVALVGRLAKLLPESPAAIGLIGGMIGITTVNFFLHGWADSSTALVYWTYGGIIAAASYGVVSVGTPGKGKAIA